MKRLFCALFGGIAAVLSVWPIYHQNFALFLIGVALSGAISGALVQPYFLSDERGGGLLTSTLWRSALGGILCALFALPILGLLVGFHGWLQLIVGSWGEINPDYSEIGRTFLLIPRSGIIFLFYGIFGVGWFVAPVAFITGYLLQLVWPGVRGRM